MAPHTYLVFTATGRQGREAIKSLGPKLAEGESIVATSRTPDSAAARAVADLPGVSKVLRADFFDQPSLLNAVKESGATRVFFATDFWRIPWHKRTRKTEAATGYAVIDAILEANANAGDGPKVEHVVFSSVCDADSCPEGVSHFRGKADVEARMAERFDDASGVTWSVIRPVAFFENVDDAANFNPLVKGRVKMLTYPDKKVKFVSCEDIGKASAVLLTDPGTYAGKKVDAAGGEHTGLELAAALSEASGTECVYAMSVPRPALRMLMGDLYRMTAWFESDGYTADVEEFKKIVPDAQDARAFFERKGQWADGEKFAGK